MKSYNTQDEFKDRLSNWEEVDRKIKLNNSQADASGNPDHLRMGHNSFSDMTLSEKQKRLGFVLPEDKKEAPRTLLDDRRP